MLGGTAQSDWTPAKAAAPLPLLCTSCSKSGSDGPCSPSLGIYIPWAPCPPAPPPWTGALLTAHTVPSTHRRPPLSAAAASEGRDPPHTQHPLPVCLVGSCFCPQ